MSDEEMIEDLERYFKDLAFNPKNSKQQKKEKGAFNWLFKRREDNSFIMINPQQEDKYFVPNYQIITTLIEVECKDCQKKIRKDKKLISSQSPDSVKEYHHISCYVKILKEEIENILKLIERSQLALRDFKKRERSLKKITSSINAHYKLNMLGEKLGM